MYIQSLLNNYKTLNSTGMGFPGGPVVKKLPATTGDTRDTSLIPGSGRFPGVGNATCSSIRA